LRSRVAGNEACANAESENEAVESAKGSSQTKDHAIP
jgi:hypothetical protein